MLCSPCTSKRSDVVEPSPNTLAVDSRRRSLPGNNTGFLDICGEAEEEEAKGESSTTFDKVLDKHKFEAQALATAILERADDISKKQGTSASVARHPEAFAEAHCFPTYVPLGCFVVGHTNTDMDSVASAIGAAHLFGGVACRAERSLNGEITHALEFSEYDKWEGRSGIDLSSGKIIYGAAARKAQEAQEAAVGKPGAASFPPFIDDLPMAIDPYNASGGLVLVDHNEPGQSPTSIGNVLSGDDAKRASAMRNRIKGVIDHHAVSDKFKSSGPCFVDIRPWGSACSIVTSMYVRLGKPMPVPVAKVLLCGILSDTINLTSPTTTDADRLMATLLVFLAGVEHPNQLASAMFKAKTRWFVDLGAYEMVRGDQKTFSAGEAKFGWATVEVTAADVVLETAAEILLELRVLKEEKGYNYVFLSVVDIIQKPTWLLLCGAGELALAREAFGGETSAACPPDSLTELHKELNLYAADTKMDLGTKVSRKLEFVPPVVETLSSGWTPPAEIRRKSLAEEAPFAFVDQKDACCKLQRRFSRAGDLEAAAAVKHGHAMGEFEA